MPKTRNNASSSGSQRNATQTQASQSEGQSQMPKAEAKKAIADCVRFLFASASESGVPIKRSDIVKHTMKGQGKYFNAIIEPVKSQLEEVYNYRLMEVDSNTNKSLKQYILVRNAGEQLDSLLTFTEKQKSTAVLRLIILAHIHMSGGCIPEEKLFKYLSALTIIREEGAHPLFGDVKKRIEHEFTKEMYLELDNNANYRWGKRAIEEVDDEKIVEFVKNILHGQQGEELQQDDDSNADKENRIENEDAMETE